MICIRLLDDHKTYGKIFKVDSCSNYDVTSKTIKYYNPAFVSNYLLDSYYIYYYYYIVICIRLLDDYKTYGKNFQKDPYSNYDVTPKKLNITIELLFKNFMLDSHENSYTSRLV